MGAKTRQAHRTVYLAVPNHSATLNDSFAFQPAHIKTGISDGIYTEVLDGLSEGAVVLTGLNVPHGAPTAYASRNPFGAKPK